MKIQQVAAQLYTVRNQTKTPADVITTLRKVKKIGYPAIEASGLPPISGEELAKLVKDEGLLCCSTHEPSDVILNEPEKVVQRLKALGTRHTGYPYPNGINFDTLESVKEFAGRLNRSGKILHDAGLVLSYHHHHIEFRRLGNKTVLEIIFEETDPRYLKMKIDTYWVQYGGGNPVDWCKRYKGRLPLIHLKDFRINKENAIEFSEIGSGNLSWKEIITAAESSGCEWFIVEQDTCPGDPFDSLKQSFEYISENLCSK